MGRPYSIFRSLIINSQIVFPAIAGSISASAFIVSQPFLLVIGLSFFILSLQNKMVKVVDRVGLSYGLAYYFIGVSWFFAVDDQYQATSHAVLLGFELLAILLMSIPFAIVAIFIALFPVKSRESIFWFVAIVAPSLTLLEWVKTWYFSGFPWFQTSHIFTGTFLKGWFALLGDIGVSFLFYLFVSGLCYVIVSPQKIKNLKIYLLVLFTFIGVTLAVGTIDFTSTVSAKSLNVQIINDRASHNDKRTYNGRVSRVKKYQKIALEGKDVDISVWPESSTGTGVYEDIKKDVSEGFFRLKHNKRKVFFGSYQQEGIYVKNSIFSSFSQREAYTKQHLVPVGEYIPKWFALFDIWIPGSFRSSTISDPLLNTALTHKEINIAPMICYEVLFGNELRKRSKDTGILIGVSNLEALKPLWVKDHFFNLSRIRAMELQKPLLQSTNFGISGIISSNGEIVKKLSTAVGVMLESVKPRKGSTPFAKYGYSLVISISLFLILIGTWRINKFSNINNENAKHT